MPDDGNCTSTGPHLDPFERGEVPGCDSDLPQTCQVGDLAGKHGAIVTTDSETTYQTSYTDDFTAVSKDISSIMPDMANMPASFLGVSLALPVGIW